jgi:hypothetical protein
MIMFKRKRSAADFADEIRAHLDASTAHGIASHSNYFQVKRLVVR